MGLRIIHFYKHYLGKGGIPRETQLLAEAMAVHPEVEKVFVYCLSPNAPTTHFSDGRTTVRAFYLHPWLYKTKFNIVIPGDLVAAFRQNLDQADVVILTGSFIGEHYWLRKVLRRCGLPYIVSIGEAFNPNTFVGYKTLSKRVWHLFFEKAVLKNAAAIRLYSEVQQEHLKEFGFQGIRTFIVKEGIDYAEVPRDVRPRFDSVIRVPPTFGYLGRFDLWKKGIDLLLKAFKRYRASGGKGKLIMCGPTVSAGARQVRTMICCFGLEEHVEMIGPLYGKDKVKFLEEVSVLCVTSRHEGIPRVVREAIALGRPVIVTPHTNMHDVVKEFGAGIVVEANVASIASALKQFELLGENDKAGMAKNAFTLSRKLDWANVADEYVRALKDVLGA